MKHKETVVQKHFWQTIVFFGCKKIGRQQKTKFKKEA